MRLKEVRTEWKERIHLDRYLFQQQQQFPAEVAKWIWALDAITAAVGRAQAVGAAEYRLEVTGR